MSDPAKCPTCHRAGTEAQPFDGHCPAAWAHKYVAQHFAPLARSETAVREAAERVLDMFDRNLAGAYVTSAYTAFHDLRAALASSRSASGETDPLTGVTMPRIEQKSTKRIPRDESTPENRAAWEAIKRAADRGPALPSLGGSAPTDELPMQPVVLVDGVIRFRANPIVRYLLDHGGLDLNHLASMPGKSDVYGGAFSPEDWRQFAQLIGYSVSGYGDLSYVTDESYDAADKAADVLRATLPSEGARP